jgi:hypothetical protein
MPDISATTLEERHEASGDREEARPDLQRVPDNPPVDEDDVARGREKLERVLAK